MCAKSASTGTAEFIGNGILVSVGTDLVLPSPMGSWFVNINISTKFDKVWLFRILSYFSSEMSSIFPSPWSGSCAICNCNVNDSL